MRGGWGSSSIFESEEIASSWRCGKRNGAEEGGKGEGVVQEMLADLMQARTRALPSAAHTMERRWGDAAGPQNSKTPAAADGDAAAGDDGGRIHVYSCIKLNFGSLPGASGSGGGEAAEDRRMRSLLRAACDVQRAMRKAWQKTCEQIALCCLPDW